MTNINENRKKSIISICIKSSIILLLLSVFKIIYGSMINSTIIKIDGIDSIQDALVFIMTIFAIIFTNKNATKKHPLGYGRFEYLSSFIITVVFILISAIAFKTSIEGIIKKDPAPNYDNTTIILIVISLIINLILGKYVLKKGNEYNSISLIMGGKQITQNYFIAISVLLSTALTHFFNINLEFYFSALLSLMILKESIELLIESMNKIIGSPVDKEYKNKIKSAICMEEGVLNVNNVYIHNYGENIYIGSVDIEVDEKLTAKDISILSRNIEKKMKEHNLTLTTVGISGTNITDPKAIEMWDKILEVVIKHTDIIRAESFVVDLNFKYASFSIIKNLNEKTDIEYTIYKIKQELKEIYPDFNIDIDIDIDI